MNISRKLVSWLEKYRKKVTAEDARRLSSDEEKRTTACCKASQIGVLEEAKLLLDFVRDFCNGKYRDVSWPTVATLTAALAYLISPLDLVPDFIFGVGLLDDAAVIALVVKQFRNELERYREWRESLEGRFAHTFGD